MNPNSYIYQQILVSSERVAIARRMFGLKDNEYVITLQHYKAVIGNSKNKKIKLVKEIKGCSPYEFYRENVLPYVQKEINDYFGVRMNGIGHILKRKPLVTGYGLFVAGEKKTIGITFAEKLNAAQLKMLIKDVEKWMDSFFEGPGEYEKVKPIVLFDEKFLLLREYQSLRKEYPKGIPSASLEALRKKTTDLLGISVVYTADDFRSTMSEFKKTFFG